jgi:hypothetical protein
MLDNYSTGSHFIPDMQYIASRGCLGSDGDLSRRKLFAELAGYDRFGAPRYGCPGTDFYRTPLDYLTVKSRVRTGEDGADYL